MRAKKINPVHTEWNNLDRGYRGPPPKRPAWPIIKRTLQVIAAIVIITELYRYVTG